MKIRKLLSIAAALAIAPSSASANVNYTVQKGDTYWLIAQRFNASFPSVLSSNNATTSSPLAVGQIITVPSNTYTVQKGDTYYLIAKKCGVSLSSLLSANGANTSSVIYEGTRLTIPSGGNYTYHTVQKGDTYWKISQQYGVSLPTLLSANGANESSVLQIGDRVNVPTGASTSNGSSTGTTDSKPYVTYITYTVKSDDTFWDLSIDFGIPLDELLSANSLTEASNIYIGMKLSIPVHHIPVKSTPAAKYGELLDWFSEAQYVVPINKNFKVTDLTTGKSFNARRTVGSGHADCETLTASDTAAMKQIWDGDLDWDKRSVIIEVDGRKIAASAAGKMHAGNDWDAGGVWTSWRSDDYGAGINYDYIKGNDANGHFDIHFYNSIGHSSGTISEAHQANVLKSAGLS